MLATVEVRAPSRLHFGMFSFGRTDTRQFGGVGVMVDQPGLLLRVSRSEQLNASGPLADRASQVARRVAEHLQIAPSFQIDVLSAPPAHVGLGSGTQLGMSIAAGIYALQGEPTPGVEQLVAASGRAKRSAIGAHGFVHGGLLIESGKLQADELSPLLSHVSLPADWRFVLLTPRGDAGLHGTAEVTAFERLPPVDPAVSAELQRLAVDELLPAANAGNFLRFRDTLEAFNDLAGACFATVQGGHYAPQAQRVIDDLRAQNVRGYAQTSWGPTVCVVCESPATAEALANHWRVGAHDVDVLVTTIAQHGATVQS
jgi:beta-RFAP synthase